eukprot:m.61229 g.61229  ORF g.61229 m.61229 type:complete len:66 (-) comp11382_c0_seq1:3748-3945(-)
MKRMLFGDKWTSQLCSLIAYGQNNDTTKCIFEQTQVIPQPLSTRREFQSINQTNEFNEMKSIGID